LSHNAFPPRPFFFFLVRDGLVLCRHCYADLSAPRGPSVGSPIFWPPEFLGDNDKFEHPKAGEFSPRLRGQVVSVHRFTVCNATLPAPRFSSPCSKVHFFALLLLFFFFFSCLTGFATLSVPFLHCARSPCPPLADRSPPPSFWYADPTLITPPSLYSVCAGCFFSLWPPVVFFSQLLFPRTLPSWFPNISSGLNGIPRCKNPLTGRWIHWCSAAVFSIPLFPQTVFADFFFLFLLGEFLAPVLLTRCFLPSLPLYTFLVTLRAQTVAFFLVCRPPAQVLHCFGPFFVVPSFSPHVYFFPRPFFSRSDLERHALPGIPHLYLPTVFFPVLSYLFFFLRIVQSPLSPPPRIPRPLSRFLIPPEPSGVAPLIFAPSSFVPPTPPPGSFFCSTSLSVGNRHFWLRLSWTPLPPFCSCHPTFLTSPPQNAPHRLPIVSPTLLSPSTNQLHSVIDPHLPPPPESQVAFRPEYLLSLPILEDLWAILPFGL